MTRSTPPSIIPIIIKIQILSYEPPSPISTVPGTAVAGAGAAKVAKAVGGTGVGQAAAAAGKAVVSGARAVAKAPVVKQAIQGANKGLQAVHSAGKAVGEKTLKAGDKLLQNIGLTNIKVTAEQAQNLKNLARAEFKVLEAAKKAGKTTNAEISPALSVAQDLNTGKISQVWRNNTAGKPPPNLSETLAKRWLDAPDEVLAFERTHGMASHAEVYAVDELLKARPNASLSDFAVFTMETRIAKYLNEFKPACVQCNWLLNGVQYVK